MLLDFCLPFTAEVRRIPTNVSFHLLRLEIDFLLLGRGVKQACRSLFHPGRRRADFEPVQAQGVVHVDLAGLVQRQDISPGLFLADQPRVALKLRDQQREPGDLDSETLDLDPVKIFELDPGFWIIVEPPDDLMLDLAHPDIGDDQKIAGAAGGIEDADRGDAAAQVFKLAHIVARLLQ